MAEQLVLALEHYEGPIDALLELARAQKVDLMQIQILPLVEQYLAFVARAEALELELSADYLVMAAWLTYLKSRLLLPEPVAEEAPSAENLADIMRFRLRQLEAMQDAAQQLRHRFHLGRDWFARGFDVMEPNVAAQTRQNIVWQAELGDLIAAYAAIVTRQSPLPGLVVTPSPLYSLEAALAILAEQLTWRPTWTELRTIIPASWRETAVNAPLQARSAVVSLFAAGLQLVKSGRAEMQQAVIFGPLYLRGVNPVIDRV